MSAAQGQEESDTTTEEKVVVESKVTTNVRLDGSTKYNELS